MSKRKYERNSFEMVELKFKRHCAIELNTASMIGFLKPGAKFNLFSMCLDFIAANIDAVESLDEFPSLIGEIIFKRCIELQKFKQVQNLKLFVSAYPEHICETVDLSYRDLFNYTHFLSVITPCRIVELNLDNSDITSSGLNLFDLLKASSCALQVLSLRSNNLNDDYLRKITLPVRIGQVRFERLRRVDLVDNPRLSSACLVNFEKFTSLEEILVDFKSVTGQLKACKCPDKINTGMSISSKGWLAPLDLYSLMPENKNESNNFHIVH